MKPVESRQLQILCALLIMFTNEYLCIGLEKMVAILEKLGSVGTWAASEH